MDNKMKYIWSADEWLCLRNNLRTVATLSGCLPDFPRQEVFFGLPAELLPEQVAILKHHQVLRHLHEVEHPLSNETSDAAGTSNDEGNENENENEKKSNETDHEQMEEVVYDLCAIQRGKNLLSPAELLKLKVFMDLREKGYYLTCGSKFGGDFLAYLGDPVKYHSRYIVVCFLLNVKFSVLQLITMGRIGSSTNKTVILSTLSLENKIMYQSLCWQ